MVEVSIVVPFRNEINQLKKLFQGIKNQTTVFDYEVIVLDSSDKSQRDQIIQLYPQVEYHRVLPHSFNHGNTRNFGVKFSKGKIIVFTVQDALPTNENWLTNLVSPIFSKNLHAICGKQKPNPYERTNPVEQFNPIDPPSIRIVDIMSSVFINLCSSDKLKYTGWDNVNCAYLKSALEDLPFRERMFGEDAQWAVDAILKGYRIGYTDFSEVYHYHSYDDEFNFKRCLAEYYTRFITIGLAPTKPTFNLRIFISWLRRIYKSTINPISIFYWLNYNFRIYKTSKKAYHYWENYDFTSVERYLLHNVPMSEK